MALEDIGTSIASDLTKDLLVTMKRQASYFFCFNNIAKDLGAKKDKLVLKQQGHLKRAEDANNNTEQISDKVQKWLEEAQKHIEETNNLEAMAKEKRKYFLGWCPNCIWQYRLGRKMTKKIEEVVEHHENSEFNYFSRLRTLTGQGLDSSNDFIYFESRNVAYVQLLEALRDSKNFRIGLYGMGGLGKTSLVKEVQKEAMKSKSFDKVVFVVVSNPPDVRKIQEEIAESLRLEFKEQYESNRAQRLYMRLTNGEKILLILDDVWCELNFKAIGIPLDDSHQCNCRVLLTTRKAQVCRSMNCQSAINLSQLSKADAWFLFKKHANIVEETSPNRLQAVAQDIAEQCKGLPVAIAAVASTLKNQDLQVWEEALSTLKDSKTLDNIDPDLMEIYRCLKLSFDNLKNERAEKLFLLCSLFPEDYEIPMEDLIRYAIGLGIFGDVDSYGTMRFQVCQAKNKLIDSCMLLNASSQRESVRMHDLIRDVAQLIAKKEIQVIMGEQKDIQTLSEDIMFNVRYLWLRVNIIDETPLDWPNLRILVMSVDSLEYIEDVADTVFMGMKPLQVLTLIRASRLPLTKMRIPELINLQTLRLKKWILGDIRVIGNLKKLKTLELEKCIITELPDEILELKKLRLLGLFKCLIRKNPFGVMGKFSQLEELYFTKDKKYFEWWNDWKADWKVDCESISEFFNEKCCLKKLKRYLIEIGDDCRLSGSMNYLNPKGLYIQRFDASSSNDTIMDLAQRAEILHLQDSKVGYKSISPDIVQAVGGLNELIELELDSFLEIECLLDTTNHSSEIVTIFSSLVKLRLRTMHNLKELCHGPSPSNFLQKLVTLDLFECSKLQNILFVGNLNLRNLKSMQVSDCPTLTSLFTLSIAHNLELLEKLVIERCNGLKYIIADQREMDNEENIVQEKDEHDQKISDGSMFPKLTYIDILRCDSLEWIFPLSFAGNLKQLEEMRIREAAELKNIFGQYQHEDHPLHENAKEIILPSLRTMWLLRTPNFISIFPIYYHPTDQPMQSIDLELKLLTESAKSTYKNSDWGLPAAIVPCLSKQLLNLSLLTGIELSSIPKLVSLFKLSTAQEMLLKRLVIEDCHELMHIIANEEEDHDDNNYDSATVFPKLRTLIVTNCSILKMLLPVSFSHGLVQLQFIRLEDAPQLEYVFGPYDDHLSHQIENDTHIEFPALYYLKLARLPRMISICSRNFYPTWPILKFLNLSTCHQLKISSIIVCITKKGSRIEVQALENTVNFKKLHMEDDGEFEGIYPLEVLPSSRQQTQLSSGLQVLELEDLPQLRHICKTPLLLSFQNLISLTVHGCGKLSYVFSTCVLRDLPQLKFLFIRDCDQLEQIIEDEEDHKVCLPALYGIEIHRCNKLKSLFSINTSNPFPKLVFLKIEEASQLEVVFTHKMCNAEDNLMFPSLLTLRLVKLPSLVSVCHGFKLQSVIAEVKECPKLASTSTGTAEAFPHEYQNAADEENIEPNEKEEEENIMAVVDNSCSTETNVMSQDKGKQPAESVLTSNERKDPQTSTNHEEENHAVTAKSSPLAVDSASYLSKQNVMSSVAEYATPSNIGPSKHSGEKEENREVDIEVVQTALINPNGERDTSRRITIKEEKESKEAQTEKREATPTANPIQGDTTKDPSDAVPGIPSTFCPGSSSETLLSSASLLSPNPALSSQVDPLHEEYANFRDVGAIKKKHIPLLEEAIIKYPSLWTWHDHQKFRHPKIIKFGYDILGEMLELLASTRWRDLTKEKKAEFESLIYELEMTFAFDIHWLKKICAMVKQGRFNEETINHVLTLEAKVMEQETEVEILLSHVQMAKAKLNKTKSELDAIRGEVGNFNDFIGF